MVSIAAGESIPRMLYYPSERERGVGNAVKKASVAPGRAPGRKAKDSAIVRSLGSKTVARLTLGLLGDFRVRAGSDAQVIITSKKAQALLAYLAITPGQRHPRDQVATLLWGDAGEAQARQSLRQTLLSLRRALPKTTPPILMTDTASVAVTRAIEVDAVRFEQLASERKPDALERALALYRGDLLSGVRLRGSRFEAWLQGERERLRNCATDALERMSTYQVKRRMIDGGVQTGLRLLREDPSLEPVHRALMRLYLQSGRRGAALKQYRLCVDTLQRELAVRPDTATTRLYQEIMTGGLQPAPPAVRRPRGPSASQYASPAAPLVGRQAELAQLQQVLDQARQGRGHLVTVCGEAGIGKSRLIQELAVRAEAAGGRVVVGRCFESEQVLPFGPWVGILRSEAIRAALDEVAEGDAPHRRELARLLPELGGRGTELPAGGEDYRRIFEAVTQVVKAVAARTPTVLILEDLHWADGMSVRLLAFLARRSRSWPFLLVASVRDEELLDSPIARRLLAELDREGATRPLRLAPLSEAETLMLVTHLDAGRAGRDVMESLGRRIWRLSEGHPFMVVETMRALQEGTTPAAPEQLPLAERIQEVIRGRLERLTARSQKLVAVAAVISREFECALLQHAAGVSQRAAAEGVEELVRLRVLHSVGERFAFAHDRIREVAYGQLLQPRRRLLHGAVARALEDRYAENLEPHWGTLGLHYREAGGWSKAANYFRRAAAVAAMQGAHHEAVAYLDQALAALERLPKRRDTLEQAIDVRFALGNSLVPLARVGRFAACLRDAERAAATLDDQPRLGWALAHLSYQLWLTGPAKDSCASAERARAIGERLGDIPLTVYAKTCLGVAHFIVAEYRQAAEHLEKAVALLDGDLARQRCGMDVFPSVICRHWLALTCAERGEFDRGIAYGQEAVRLAEALDHPYSVSAACWGLGSVYAARQLHAEAILALERSLSLVRDWRLEILSPAVKARLGSVYAASGRVVDGLALLHQVLDGYRHKPSAAFHSLVTVHLGDAYVLAKQLDDALVSAKQAVALARESNERGTEAKALRLLGEVTSRQDANDSETAEAYYRQAMVLATELGMRPLVARCHLGLGTLYRRTGARKQADEYLIDGTTMYREMGMTSWLESAETELK